MSRGVKIGAVYGRLRVISRVDQPGKSVWTCLCECGVSKPIKGEYLTGGATKSCGCLRRETTANRARGPKPRPGDPLIKAFRKEYNILSSAICRCHNERSKDYYLYGALGVSVAPEWRKGSKGRFASFLAAMGPRPSSSHSMDRIDPFGNYEPGNVRWATPAQQVANRRRTSGWRKSPG
jgi:hypothetical protein